ncbi:MAG: thioredoxin family protein [Flavobacteriaceae bacterium]|nr:thioredoxin family protein [Flavobacteriaceae bacterium]
MATSITSLDDFHKTLRENQAVLIYFNTSFCNVGEALEPKVKNLVKTHFPKVAYYQVDMNFLPEISTAYSVFVEPTIIVFFEGKETIRKSRNIGVSELHEAISRPYQLIFE